MFLCRQIRSDGGTGATKRVQMSFLPTSTLWSILSQFDAGDPTLELTTRRASAGNMAAIPVIRFMRTEIGGLSELQVLHLFQHLIWNLFV